MLIRKIKNHQTLKTTKLREKEKKKIKIPVSSSVGAPAEATTLPASTTSGIFVFWPIS
jgi:hypothetical protein